ncbi:MAG TPA: HlyD family efflux transporter periplasmic adaptor subunit, partial [Rhodanobacteraceae bacterium]|nr:HlyD family efflux transporter periplasmic adaptor subunit [Rhodanobacteraceae bacterium]
MTEEATGLYRMEVLATRQNEWLGSIRLQLPRFGWFFFGLGAFATVAIFGLLIGGQYTRHVHVNGTLVPSEGSVVLTPPADGIVTRLLVREGERVRTGQPLLEISGEKDSVALGDTHAAIAAQLQIKRERLLSDLDEQKQLASMQQKDLDSRKALLKEQVARLDQQISLQRQRADSAMALYQQWSKLGNTGVVSKLQLLQQHDAALQELAQVKDLEGQRFQLEQQAAQLQAQVDELPATVSSKRNQTERDLADVAQALSQNAVQRAVSLRAPYDGTVANILVHSGQVVFAQQSLMAVLPAKSRLQAELWVPTEAVGFITPGERVTIRYAAYPYQKFGQYSGKVREVSRSAMPAADVSRFLGESIKEPRFRVQIALDSQSVLAYGRQEALKPGMTLQADILLGRRRLIEWVFEPLYGFSKSLYGAGKT